MTDGRSIRLVIALSDLIVHSADFPTGSSLTPARYNRVKQRCRSRLKQTSGHSSGKAHMLEVGFVDLRRMVAAGFEETLN